MRVVVTGAAGLEPSVAAPAGLRSAVQWVLQRACVVRADEGGRP
jgi:hypothetical protein